MGITKTDFMRGMQCHKMLWLDKHKPKLKVIPPEVQKRLDAGNDFGDKAMSMFGDYLEMTINRPGTSIPDTKAMAQKTAESMELGIPVITEAAFIYYNNYCAVDILRKNDIGYDMYEVKNSPDVHYQFIKDVAFQYYILHKCKVSVGNIYIVTHGNDDDNPYVITDVTTQAKELFKWIDDNIWDLNRMQKSADEVEVTMGDQCHNPYDCWYCDYCKSIR